MVSYRRPVVSLTLLSPGPRTRYTSLSVLFLRASSEPVENARQKPKPLCGNALYGEETGRRIPSGRSIDGCSRGSAKNWKSSRAAANSSARWSSAGPTVLQSFLYRNDRAATERTPSPLPAARSGPVERGSQSRVPRRCLSPQATRGNLPHEPACRFAFAVWPRQE